MSECRIKNNMAGCNCSYEPCPRKGVCCECVAYHRKSGELPACFFPDSAEKTYNRSLSYFLKINGRG